MKVLSSTTGYILLQKRKERGAEQLTSASEEGKPVPGKTKNKARVSKLSSLLHFSIPPLSVASLRK